MQNAIDILENHYLDLLTDKPPDILYVGDSNENKIGQHPELFGAVPHPSSDFYRVKTAPGAIKPFMRPFAQVMRQIQQNCGPDLSIRVPGSGDRELMSKSCNIN